MHKHFRKSPYAAGSYSSPSNLRKKLINGKLLLIMTLPGIVYYIIFHYIPIWGILIAFKDYSLFKGFWDSPVFRS